jgi:glycosyltransferase involved in cell wall biosynthesis
MLAGIPIVATRVGAVPELIEDGKHGLLVPTGSATALCEALSKMFNDNTTRQDFGKQAQKRVLSKFAPQIELATYWGIYQQCRGHSAAESYTSHQ